MSSTMRNCSELVPNWTPRQRPVRAPLTGHWCTLEPLDPDRHTAQLHAAFAQDASGSGWTYLPYGPFADADSYADWLRANALGVDPQFFAVIESGTGRAIGVVSFLRIDPAHGTIEIGHIHWSPVLQRTPAATEAIFMLLDLVFALGYRRCEWKCDAANMPSRGAAARFGFRFEGEFLQHMIVKGRNRDTTWFAILDREWPALRAAYESWLRVENFDERGRQRSRLAEAVAAANSCEP